jgi:uncharacterized protein YegL
MGWGKYHEDNVSRFVRDADTRMRMGEYVPIKTPQPTGEIRSLKHLQTLRKGLEQSPTDRNLQNLFHAEKIRLAKLGVSPGEIQDVIHGGTQSVRSPTESALPDKGKEEMLKEFTVVSARPLPVIVLADVSGSMSKDGKIEALNRSIREMVASFGNEDDLRAEVQVGVITFGGSKAEAKQPLVAANKLAWEDLKAIGKTPLGSAFALATEWLESREVISARAYAPTLVLISDGQPDKGDSWAHELERLLSSPRGKKAQRLALAIGEDADQDVLKAFISNPDVPVLRANEASQISQFFRLVTMSVCSRLSSVDPNQPLPIETFDLDKFDNF